MCHVIVTISDKAAVTTYIYIYIFFIYDKGPESATDMPMTVN